ncbi:hypothetical protein V6U90_04775 [Micromonospora sp. CPCC 206060]|uniref:hypothetical protein n=1 Tax=Micromonospora sp. CPCC 206060 TaxID=3122406 RepID=UPI002FF06B23
MGRTTRRSLLAAFGAAAVVAPLGIGRAAAAAPSAAADGPTVLADPGALLADRATDLITNLDQIGWPAESAYNFYSATGAPTTIVFGTSGQPTTYRNETRCATFVRRLLTHAFPTWATTSYFTAEFGTSFPNSAIFHDRFEADRQGTDDLPNFLGFSLNFGYSFNLRPGDIMAIKYVDAPSTDSGHMAIVGSGSHLFNDANPAYREWAIRVIDSTSSAHGNPDNPLGYPDTRFYQDPADNIWKEATGAGMGWMFVRTDRATGALISHRWSRNSSTWYGVDTRPVALGRLNLLH